MGETAIQLKRHYHELSPEETDEVVNAVADLIVNYLKGRRKESTLPAAPAATAQAGHSENKREVNHERNGNQPTEYC